MGSVHVDQGTGWGRVPWLFSGVCTVVVQCDGFARILGTRPVWAAFALSALLIISIFAFR